MSLKENIFSVIGPWLSRSLFPYPQVQCFAHIENSIHMSFNFRLAESMTLVKSLSNFKVFLIPPNL